MIPLARRGDFVAFCFQMWMNAPRMISVLAAYVPTQRDPTPVPDVRLATEFLKTERGVRVSSSQALALF